MTDRAARQWREVSREGALRLLGSVSYGWIVFTERALPAVDLSMDHIIRIHPEIMTGQVPVAC